MESKTCEICGKLIEGYKISHVDYLMKQHKLTHEHKINKEVENGKTNDIMA